VTTSGAVSPGPQPPPGRRRGAHMRSPVAPPEVEVEADAYAYAYSTWYYVDTSAGRKSWKLAVGDTSYVIRDAHKT
jgi:hypothetical protein